MREGNKAMRIFRWRIEDLCKEWTDQAILGGGKGEG